MTAEQDPRRSPVKPAQDRPVLAVIRRTLAQGGYTVHATSLQYLVDLVDALTADRDALRAEVDRLSAYTADDLIDDLFGDSTPADGGESDA